jgi:hypothetical protein
MHKMGGPVFGQLRPAGAVPCVRSRLDFLTEQLLGSCREHDAISVDGLASHEAVRRNHDAAPVGARERRLGSAIAARPASVSRPPALPSLP